MRKALKETILQTQRQAGECADALVRRKYRDKKEFTSLFVGYLCAKFMLQPEEIQTDNFYEICRLSADKAAKLPDGVLGAAELASKCGGATTAMNKKVLFLMAVKRELLAELSPEEGAAVNLLSELVGVVYERM